MSVNFLDPSKMDRKTLIDFLKTADSLDDRYSVKKYDSYKPHAEGEDGGQEAFHKAAGTHVVRVVCTGNRYGKCLTSDTLIDSPVGQSTLGELFDRGGKHLVWAWDGEKKVSVLADAPFKKPAEECFRVWMSNGQWFECAGNHRVLTKDGWRFFSKIREYLPCLPPTSSGFSLLTRVEDVRHYLETELNSEDSYLKDFHQYGVQLPFGKEIYPTPPPSPNGVLQYIYCSLKRLGALAYKGIYSLFEKSHHLANLDFYKLALARSFVSLDQAVYNAFELYPHDSRRTQPPSTVQAFEPLSCREVCRCESDVFSPFVSPDDAANRVIAYQPIGSKDIYDFHVPVYHNYCTGGAVHHNTTAAVNEIKWLATGTHPHRHMKIPNRGKFYGESFSWISDVLEPKLKEWINPNLLDPKRPYEYNNQGGLTQINWACGSVTRIGTYEQEGRKAEGSNWDYIGFDEPPKHELWVGNFRGIVDNKGIIWITATPLSEPWIYDELWLKGLNGEKPYVKCFRGKSSDNKHIPKDMLDLYFSEIPDDMKAVRFNGEFAKLSGLVINTYNPMLSDIDEFELDANYAIYEGIDPHSNKPHAVLWKAVDRDGFRYTVREINFDGTMAEFALKLSEVREDLERHGAKVVRSVIDSAVNQKDFILKTNVYKELCNELNKLKSPVIPRIAVKGKGSLDETITRLKDLYRPAVLKKVDTKKVEEDVAVDPYMTEIYGIDNIIKTNTKTLEIKVPKQYIFKDRCPMYRRELLRYRWPKDSGDKDVVKPVDDNNEFISCDRYIEQLNPRWMELGASRVIRTPVRGRM